MSLPKAGSLEALRAEDAALRTRLAEAEEALEAIRSGDVDAVVVGGRVVSLIERRVAERTTELTEANEALAAARLAALNVMEDALAARQAAEQAAAALRESEDKLRYVFEGSLVGKSITLPTGEISVNRALCEMLGYSRNELSTRKWQEISHPEDLEATQRQLATILSGEKDGARFIKRYLRKDGSVVWADVSTALRRDPDGRPLYFMTAVSDITERKRAEDALHRLTERLQSLRRIDQAILLAVESPEAIAQTALRHLRDLLHCRRASVGIYEPERKEVRVFAAEVDGETIVQAGKDLPEEAYGDWGILRRRQMEIVEDLPGVASQSAVARVLQAEGIRSSINVPLFSKGGLVGALNVGWEEPRVITPEEVEIAGEVARQITIAIEQARLLEETKRHAAELEQRVADRTAQLEASNKELEAFSYSVSHDLRAPLRAINGYARILIEDHGAKLDAEGQRVLGVVRSEALRMGRLIDDLLEFSRLGRQPPRKAPTDMTALVREVQAELLGHAPGRAVDFRLDSLPAVSADPALLRQVWVNLLDNALKYTRHRQHAEIVVAGSMQGGEAVYSVKDNGTGFDMKYADKLFGVFQRLHRADEFEGTGVGLALVQRLVHSHGGRVWAQAEADRGATFYFALPVAEEPAAPDIASVGSVGIRPPGE
jgi:PAS domain S-box-containing protein